MRVVVLRKAAQSSFVPFCDVFVCGHLSRLVKVTYVDFEHDERHGNPVMAYLWHHGSARSASIPVAAKYHLTLSTNPSLYHAPSTNEPHSKVSGDFDPIHMNPYFAAYASLPGSLSVHVSDHIPTHASPK